MTASCASSVSSCSGFGCRLWGAAEASGGLDIRDARGADVCGSNVASGSQRADNDSVSDAWLYLGWTTYLEAVVRLWALSAAPLVPLVSHLLEGRVVCPQLLWHSSAPDSLS
jgi:hypothetical protein